MAFAPWLMCRDGKSSPHQTPVWFVAVENKQLTNKQKPQVATRLGAEEAGQVQAALLEVARRAMMILPNTSTSKAPAVPRA
jgi:hypothetical protein